MADRRAASSPRCTRGSASRRRSSSPGPRLVPTEHPRNAEAVRSALERDGSTVRTGVRALARPGGRRHATAPTSSTSTTARPPRATSILLAVGREFPVGDLGLEHYGIDTTGPDAYPRDGRLRIADGLWVVGDPAGPELHTHQGHYQGELAVRMALGEAIVPDYRALPRATYTDPEAASVGMTLDQARDAGLDAFECVADFATTRQGLLRRGGDGPRDDRRRPRDAATLVGAAMACPDASAAIHECVLAIKARVPVDVLAETIHAFPSTSRILNGLFAEARARLSDRG